MYYVITNTPDYTITTSYVTQKQAERYGGQPINAELRLMDDGYSAQVIDYGPEDSNELTNIGKIRTIFKSHRDGADAGRFLLYMQDDEEDWYYTGIFFSSMSDANQAVKGPLSGCYGDMLILEADEVTPTSKEAANIK